jgi:hypothetical protein
MTKEEFIQTYKPRGYLHFDAQISSAKAAWRSVSRFLGGQSHQFLPFLGFTLSTNRIRREDASGTPRRERALVIRPKQRAIKIASHQDAAIYSYYGMELSALYEHRLQELGMQGVPTAFRRVGSGKCNIDYAHEVFEFTDMNRPCVALGYDIEKFFDRLSHRVLRESWARILGEDRLPPDHYRVFQSLTRFCWVSRKAALAAFGINPHRSGIEDSGKRRLRICSATEFRERIRGNGLLQHNPERHRGIPQGSPMSAVLSNIYMLTLDKVMSEWTNSVGGLYRRYCDDIMVVVPPNRAEATELLVKALVQKLELTLNDDKTERVMFSPIQGSPGENNGALPYLGFVFDGQCVRLRQSSLDRYYGKMRRGVRFAAMCRKRHSGGTPCVPLKTRKLFLRYSHLVKSQRGGARIRIRLGRSYRTSRTNFISYAIRASNVFNSDEIRHQIRGHWKKLKKQVARCGP